MKYSILGFNQALVCDLKKEVQYEDGRTKTLCLDVTDLLILKNIADFMNRPRVVKLMINDNVYFSITQKTIIEDLPILGIKKQALKDRIDKMTVLGVIEKEVLRNESGTWIGYRLTDVYERLRYYDAKNSEGVYQTTRGGCIKLHEGGVAQYNPNNNTTINVNNKEEIKEKENNELFSKKNSKKQDELEQYDLTNVSNDFIDVIREWCQYKKERREKYKTQSSFMAMVKRLVKLSSNNVAKAKEIVEQSVANNYAGLFELKQRNNNGDTPIGFILENDREDKHQNRKNW